MLDNLCCFRLDVKPRLAFCVRILCDGVMKSLVAAEILLGKKGANICFVKSMVTLVFLKLTIHS